MKSHLKKLLILTLKLLCVTYEDSLISAKSLRNAIDYFLSNPTSENLSLAKSVHGLLQESISANWKFLDLEIQLLITGKER